MTYVVKYVKTTSKYNMQFTVNNTKMSKKNWNISQVQQKSHKKKIRRLTQIILGNYMWFSNEMYKKVFNDSYP